MKALHHVISAEDHSVFKAAFGKSPHQFWDINLGFDDMAFADSVFPGYEDQDKTLNEMLHDLGGDRLVRVVHKLIDGMVSPATRLS